MRLRGPDVRLLQREEAAGRVGGTSVVADGQGHALYFSKRLIPYLPGAALDVLPEEPPPAGHPVLSHPRTVLTPHAAWYSEESEAELRRSAAQNIVAWRETGRPRTPVNEPDGR